MYSNVKTLIVLFFTLLLPLSSAHAQDTQEGISFIARVISTRLLGSEEGEVFQPKIVVVRLESEKNVGREKLKFTARLSMIDSLHPERLFIVINNIHQKKVIYWAVVEEHICASNNDFKFYKLDKFAADVEKLDDDMSSGQRYICFQLHLR